MAQPGSTERLWDKERSLWDIAQETVLHETLRDRPASGPLWKQSVADEDFESYQGVQINNADMRVSLWGRTDALNLSLRKTDVWDRRIYTKYTWPTLQSIVEASFLSINNEPGTRPSASNARGVASWFPTEKGPSREDFGWNLLPPVQKNVGQIILQLPEFANLSPPTVDIRCGDGSTKLSMATGKAKVDITCLTTMTDDKNVIAIQLDYTDLNKPIGLRLFRNKDKPNTGVAEPKSVADNGFFWIEQDLPAEATFPDGFTYYLVGYIAGADYTLETAGNQDVVSAIASIQPGSGSITVYVTVVTSAELKTGKFSGDLLAAAKTLLKTSANVGFDGLQTENADWYRAFYNAREDGRIFTGDENTGKQQITEIFRSWVSTHSLTDNPDPLQYECDSWNSTGFDESAGWHGIPVWNEAYFSQFAVKNRIDQLTYYRNLAPMWLEKGKENAKAFGFSEGWLMTHGYVPPIDPNSLSAGQYPHNEGSLEFAFDSPVFLVRLMWDIWDYGGDKTYLKEKVYPVLSELAKFYSTYLDYCTQTLQEKFPQDMFFKDGNYHAIGTTSEQHGWTPKLVRNIDPVGTLTACKWTFSKAIEAAKMLGYADPALLADWQNKLDHIAPYSTFTSEKNKATVITDVRGLDPFQFPLDNDAGYNFFDGTAPVLRTDEINLDSSDEEKKLYYNTAMLVGGGDMHQSGWTNPGVPHLLGYDKNLLHHNTPTPAWWIMEEPALLATPADLLQAAIEQPDRLINSRSGRIHLFPCVPDGSTIAFKNMLARGAFQVSAESVKGAVTYISLTSIHGGEVIIVNPFDDENLTVHDVTTNAIQKHTIAPHSSGDGIVFGTAAGHKYEIRSSSVSFAPPRPSITPEDIKTTELTARRLPYVSNYAEWEKWISGKPCAVYNGMENGLRVFDVPELLVKAYDKDDERLFIDDHVFYESSDERVIMPLSNGDMVVVGKGTATVTAGITINGETKTVGSKTFTTNKVDGGDWTFTCNPAELTAGQTGQLTIGNIERFLTEVTYKSSNPNVLEVTVHGTIIAHSSGAASITATVTKHINQRTETFSVSKTLNFSVTEKGTNLSKVAAATNIYYSVENNTIVSSLPMQQLQIYNLNGILLQNITLDGELQCALSKLISGIYLAKIRLQNGNVHTKKIIVK
ncbi:hypothetical protein AGMMS49965_13830 [Bacteroidia bacterium]|nr:hypothetical protein AGMMS49965_13830 [Bacteroidia bacterium]